MGNLRFVALSIAAFFGVFCLGSILLQPATAPVQPEPVQSAAAPARSSQVLDILAGEMNAIHDGRISPAEGEEWFNRMMAAGAADADDAPGDDVVLAARIGTTPGVVQQLRQSYREKGVSSSGFDRLLNGIAEQVRQGP
jgi:hypothetical protein